MLNKGKERTGKWNVDWRDSVGLEGGMLTGGTERSVERNVDWKSRADWKAEY